MVPGRLNLRDLFAQSQNEWIAGLWWKIVDCLEDSKSLIKKCQCLWIKKIVLKTNLNTVLMFPKDVSFLSKFLPVCFWGIKISVSEDRESRACRAMQWNIRSLAAMKGGIRSDIFSDKLSSRSHLKAHSNGIGCIRYRGC